MERLDEAIDDVELFRDAISEANHSGVHPLVRGVPVELPSSGRDDGRARSVVAIELMHMIRKGQMIVSEGENMSFADQFYSLVG